MGEVPAWISKIEPVSQTVSLNPYALNGELFPDEDSMRQFSTDVWKHWIKVPADKYDTPPHVFRFDFTGIASVDQAALRDSFAFVLGRLRGQAPRPTYSLYDNFQEGEVWSDFNQVIESTNTKVLVVARRLGRNYELVGDEPKKGTYEQIMLAFMERTGWVSAVDFERESAGLRIRPNELNLMNENGLILKQKYANKTYYRSLV